ncbi:hypothetical protein BC835DRAFT_1423835 [Cytidiella melzeri]|nr:hypothetical protein BC835DRAFT_1423835 [Cytidiella melzeri]
MKYSVFFGAISATKSATCQGRITRPAGWEESLVHSVYWRDEDSALRVLIDSKICLIEQENDPTQLRSLSVMKMYMSFNPSIRQAARRESVDILDILNLDDLPPLKYAKRFGVEDLLLAMGNLAIEPHILPGILNDILDSSTISLSWLLFSSTSSRRSAQPRPAVFPSARMLAKL